MVLRPCFQRARREAIECLEENFGAEDRETLLESWGSFPLSIGVLLARRIGPVSRPASIIIVVTPVTASPFAIAHWIGAAPR